jgi:hypothetical protein
MTRKVVATVKVETSVSNKMDCSCNCRFYKLVPFDKDICLLFGKLNPDNSRRHKNCMKAEVK